MNVKIEPATDVGKKHFSLAFLGLACVLVPQAGQRAMSALFVDWFDLNAGAATSVAAPLILGISMCLVVGLTFLSSSPTRSPSKHYGRELALSVFAVACFALANVAVKFSTGTIAASDVAFASQLLAADVFSVFLAVVAPVLIVPIIEEALFRHLLFEGLLHRWGPIVAVFVSATLFGFIHFGTVFVSILFGALMGVIRLRTSGWSICALAHCAHNLIVLAIYALIAAGETVS